MKSYDAIGIAIHTSQPSEVVRVADEVREWLNERSERGYEFVCAISGLYATVIVVKRADGEKEKRD